MWHVHTTDGYSALKGKGIQTSHNTEVTRGGCILQLSVWSMQSVWLQGQGWNRGCLGEEKSKAQSLVSKCQFCKMWRDLGQTGTTQLQQYECTQFLLNCTLKQVRTSCYMYFTKTDNLFWMITRTIYYQNLKSRKYDKVGWPLFSKLNQRIPCAQMPLHVCSVTGLTVQGPDWHPEELSLVPFTFVSPLTIILVDGKANINTDEDYARTHSCCNNWHR